MFWPVDYSTKCRVMVLTSNGFQDRNLFLQGPAAMAEKIGLSQPRVIVFDELHKYPHWRNFLKGFYDSYARGQFNIVVTGSSRLDVYRKGADSLMGRYFLYRRWGNRYAIFS